MCACCLQNILLNILVLNLFLTLLPSKFQVWLSGLPKLFISSSLRMIYMLILFIVNVSHPASFGLFSLELFAHLFFSLLSIYLSNLLSVFHLIIFAPHKSSEGWVSPLLNLSAYNPSHSFGTKLSVVTEHREWIV